MPQLLDREEYVEQAYFFHILGQRMRQNMATQDLLNSIQLEILATTKLPLALEFLAGELRLNGEFAPGMAQLSHYFAPFQTFVMAEAERERGRFDIGTALVILEREARYIAEGATPQGIFLYQFESLARNRLNYDRGLQAIADDPAFDADWKEWILTVRRQVGIVDLGDLIYVRSPYFLMQQRQRGLEEPDKPLLFGEKEGRIAWANRGKDPAYLFAALHRQLGYPEIPRLEPIDQTPELIPQLLRRMERLELRLKLVEEEEKGGIDITKFYGKPNVGE
ncbi:MAG TPA: hypothetical protein VFE24_17515 [Pirellulales bacterium]|nr:hypothetical protein [Pirellulales bacterium]